MNYMEQVSKMLGLELLSIFVGGFAIGILNKKEDFELHDIAAIIICAAIDTIILVYIFMC